MAARDVNGLFLAQVHHAQMNKHFSVTFRRPAKLKGTKRCF
jgi:hypothetical protein